ncbi:hypothetical protein A4R44_01842 [Amycolatopsis sp. M39]|nr:hypothetical protein A4R44_01842 [Amycolatopsis sp. M39]
MRGVRDQVRFALCLRIGRRRRRRDPAALGRPSAGRRLPEALGGVPVGTAVGTGTSARRLAARRRRALSVEDLRRTGARTAVLRAGTLGSAALRSAVLRHPLRTARLVGGPLRTAFVAARPFGAGLRGAWRARAARGRTAGRCGAPGGVIGWPGGTGVLLRSPGTARCIWLLARPGAVAVVVHEWASEGCTVCTGAAPRSAAVVVLVTARQSFAAGSAGALPCRGHRTGPDGSNGTSGTPLRHRR